MKSISSPDPLHKSGPARRMLGLRLSKDFYMSVIFNAKINFKEFLTLIFSYCILLQNRSRGDKLKPFVEAVFLIAIVANLTQDSQIEG